MAQVSYGATSPTLSDTSKFPTFVRTVPSDVRIVEGFADLVAAGSEGQQNCSVPFHRHVAVPRCARTKTQPGQRTDHVGPIKTVRGPF